MDILSIDIETYSDIDLKKGGVYKYVDTPNFEILLIAYAFNNEPVNIIDLTVENIPLKVLKALTDENIMKTAFNANFEMVCLEKYLRSTVADFTLDCSQWRCTMVACAQLGLPMSLDGVAQALNLDVQKNKSGTSLINYFCKPCKPTKANGGKVKNLPIHSAEKWEMFKEYCIRDVEVEREIRKRTDNYQICRDEQNLWELDQKINNHGVKVDMDLVSNAARIIDRNKSKNIERMQELTGLYNPNSTTMLRDWLEVRLDTTLKNLTKATVSELLEKIQCHIVKEVLRLKQEIAKTSIKKYDAILNSVCSYSDFRIHGLLQFYGANRTGRWAGRVVQIQNLPQNHISDLDTARDIVKMGDYESIKLMYDNIPNLLSELIRTAFIPSPGHRFIVADFSAIEARVIAWLAGENWRLEVFKTHGKIYEASAAQMFGVPIESIGKGNPLRQKGKIAELALGYGGGVGALTSMGALKLGLKEEELQPLVNQWRNANPYITKFWKDVELAAINALESGKVSLNHGLEFEYIKGILFISLPSGRKLSYVKPTIGEGRFGGKCIKYMGVNQTTRKWEYIDTFGGKLVENIVQAVARDCLAFALVNVDKAGYNINFHVHDEIVMEVPHGESSVFQIEALMSKSPPWAKGLDLRADGYECAYYKKD